MQLFFGPRTRCILKNNNFQINRGNGARARKASVEQQTGYTRRTLTAIPRDSLLEIYLCSVSLRRPKGAFWTLFSSIAIRWHLPWTLGTFRESPVLLIEASSIIATEARPSLLTIPPRLEFLISREVRRSPAVILGGRLFESPGQRRPRIPSGLMVSIFVESFVGKSSGAGRVALEVSLSCNENPCDSSAVSGQTDRELEGEREEFRVRSYLGTFRNGPGVENFFAVGSPSRRSC